MHIKAFKSLAASSVLPVTKWLKQLHRKMKSYHTARKCL